ncbi:MAG: hypothetical protein RMJ98_02165 [Myxococcales bacterium]|nr:hypothetical protein [Polyangiaceae bacterium]MDW8248094.1 hypothetical protein [Myxococcales bacterium]
MLQISSSLVALLRRLAFGTAGVAAAIALPSAATVVSSGTLLGASTLLAGCDDESQPEYWIKRLDDTAKRPAAIKRLTQFYEDGLTKHNNNREAPEMRALLDKIVVPMAQQYLKGDLDEKTRIDLLKALANTRDPKAKDAIIKAITDFAAGKAHHEEMTQAASYVKVLKLKEAAGPLLDAFTKIKVSDKNLGPPYKFTRDAMLVVHDPSWKGKLIELLNRPIPDVDPKKADKAALDTAKNEVYWQTVAAEVLGEQQAAEAIRPLFKAVLLPEKKNLAATAVVALIKIGKPAVVPLLDILANKDPEMAEISKKLGDAGKYAHIQAATLVLGSIGRAEARDPMIAALNAADNDAVRAMIGREMSKLPASPEAVRALESAFEKVSVDALIPPGEPAKIVIAAAAEKFMDASIVPWLLKQVGVLKSAKGAKEDIDNIQAALLQTAMKVMKKDQIDEVKKVIDAEGDDLSKKAFQQVTTLLNACGDNVGCYLAKMEDPATQEKNEQFVGIKAIYTLGSLGNESTKGEILKRMPKLKNDAIRFEALNLIDHLSPNGDKATADELQKILDEQAERGKETPVDPAMRQIISRLRARAS